MTKPDGDGLASCLIVAALVGLGGWTFGELVATTQSTQLVCPEKYDT